MEAFPKNQSLSSITLRNEQQDYSHDWRFVYWTTLSNCMNAHCYMYMCICSNHRHWYIQYHWMNLKCQNTQIKKKKKRQCLQCVYTSAVLWAIHCLSDTVWPSHECFWWAKLDWLTAAHQSILYLPIPSMSGNKIQQLTGENQGREIAHQLLSQSEQTHLEKINNSLPFNNAVE